MSAFHVLIGYNNDCQDQALNKRLQCCRNGEHSHGVINNVQKKNAEDRLDRTALTAGHGGTAHDNHGDNIHGAIQCQVTGCRELTGHHDHTANSCKQALCNICAPQVVSGLQTQIIGCVDIAANQVQVSAELGSAEHKLGQKCQSNEHKEHQGEDIKKFDLNVDFGWYYFLTKPFFYALDFLYGFLGKIVLA